MVFKHHFALERQRSQFKKCWCFKNRWGPGGWAASRLLLSDISEEFKNSLAANINGAEVNKAWWIVSGLVSSKATVFASCLQQVGVSLAGVGAEVWLWWQWEFSWATATAWAWGHEHSSWHRPKMGNKITRLKPNIIDCLASFCDRGLILCSLYIRMKRNFNFNFFRICRIWILRS